MPWTKTDREIVSSETTGFLVGGFLTAGFLVATGWGLNAREEDTWTTTTREEE